MVMSRFSRRERTAAVKSSVTLGSGTWTVPYGKAVIKVTGKGATGSAASGGTYWYDYSSYSPAYTDAPVLVSDAYTESPVLVSAAYDEPGSYTPATYTPGPFVSMTVYVEVYDGSYGEMTQSYAYDTSSTTCPRPTSTYKFMTYTTYDCSNNYGPGTYTPSSYTAGPHHNAVYSPGPYHPATYRTGDYHPAVYYAGYTVYYPYNPPTKGADAKFGNITFPGGYGGAASASSSTLYNQPNGGSIIVTVPSGGYVTIDTL